MRRIWTLIAAAAMLVLLLAALADASGGKPKLNLRHTRVGTILVNNQGFTVYTFVKDHHNQDICVRIAGCLIAWPPVTGGKRLAGPGVKASLIGKLKLRTGQTQLTYAGHPLYTYVGDSGPGDTSNVNLNQFGGRWPAINAKGRAVK